MPELTFHDLPLLLTENEKIKYDIHAEVNRYKENTHPRGWEILEGIRIYLEDEHFLIEAPIQDDSFGGFIRSTNTSKFICYINTNQPRIYQHFTLAHELYHVITRQGISEAIHMVKAGLDDDLDERKADYFASVLLMEENTVRSFYKNLKDEEEFIKIIKAVFRFKVPFKAVLIRLYELNLLKWETLEELFDQKVDLKEAFQDLGLDPSVIEKSNVVVFNRLHSLMKKNGLPPAADDANQKMLEDVKAYFSRIRKDEE
ncbi:ImmA/IrrE family metallo-endopeptidase [Priestia koreensis]|uniref:ImmA/IrrE family metallo-endopeptidase n=1 Tax=Priestia koreensis TaxID=284581 RepID=UPI001F58FD3A|nr:ImmA/IrrE family metallo-endopeptidase [Priestia koreensis]UNL87476.1 ImmA/IrrE family metallo-endopeptidase [Priestia koreensis]